MSRADRWWRPAGQRRNARPAVRSARRGRYAIESEAMRMFELGMDVGQADERQRREQRDEQISRIVDAIRASENGDPEQMLELGRQARGDDLLDLADAAGATPLPVADGEQLVDELERWLRGQGDG